jgi:hypothetical protein
LKRAPAQRAPAAGGGGPRCGGRCRRIAFVCDGKASHCLEWCPRRGRATQSKLRPPLWGGRGDKIQQTCIFPCHVVIYEVICPPLAFGGQPSGAAIAPPAVPTPLPAAPLAPRVAGGRLHAEGRGGVGAVWRCCNLASPQGAGARSAPARHWCAGRGGVPPRRRCLRHRRAASASGPPLRGGGATAPPLLVASGRCAAASMCMCIARGRHC